MTSPCDVCCENFNLSTRSQIKCEFSDCKFNVCKSCVRRYLLQSALDPHCMNCKKMWGQEFVVMKLNRSFISKDYKNHRRNLLLDQEMSKMSDTIEAANRVKCIKQEEKKMADINIEIEILYKAVREMKESQRGIAVTIRALQDKSPSSTEKQKFTMPCPSSTCRGFLSSQYKCQLCNIHTCPKCIEIIGLDKNIEHICDEDKVKSTELIKKSTKPCPCCGTRISKVSGCDQMWCTGCRTAFSWKSGNVETGVVHNPHFYEFQRTVNNGVVPRNPGDTVCGGLCNHRDLRAVLARNVRSVQLKKDAYFKNIEGELFSCHRFARHVEITVLGPLRIRLRPVDRNEGLRIDYILQHINKEELQTKLYRNDVTRQMGAELLHIYELFNEIIVDSFTRIIAIESKDEMCLDEICHIMSEIHALKDYCNTMFSNISITYNRTSPYISVYVDRDSIRWDLQSIKSDNYKEKKDMVSPLSLAAAEN